MSSVVEIRRALGVRHLVLDEGEPFASRKGEAIYAQESVRLAFVICARRARPTQDTFLLDDFHVVKDQFAT